MNFSSNELEKSIENAIRSAYSKKEYLRCANLLKLLYKVNKDNKILAEYILRLDVKKLESQKRLWALWNSSWLVTFIKSPKVILWFLLFYLFWVSK